jgi:uncharacterized protein (DUF302 family)
VGQIPHSEAAEGVGLQLSPNRLVVFGNPNLGTPVMQEDREAGLDLPQKMLVWEDASGNVYVGYNAVEYLEVRHEIDDASTPATIASALKNLASVASGVAAEDIDDNLNIRLTSDGVSTTESDEDFDTTWGRLIEAIDNSSAKVAFTVDHEANALGVNLSLPPTRLVVFGNPALGTPLMQASPTAGIDLPLKILVWEDSSERTQVTTNEIDFLKGRHHLEGIDEDLAAIEAALDNFVKAATKTMS